MSRGTTKELMQLIANQLQYTWGFLELRAIELQGKRCAELSGRLFAPCFAYLGASRSELCACLPKQGVVTLTRPKLLAAFALGWGQRVNALCQERARRGQG